MRADSALLRQLHEREAKKGSDSRYLRPTEVIDDRSAELERAHELQAPEIAARTAAVRALKRQMGRNTTPYELDRVLEPVPCARTAERLRRKDG